MSFFISCLLDNLERAAAAAAAAASSHKVQSLKGSNRLAKPIVFHPIL